MRKTFARKKMGALIDRSPDDASKTAKQSARALGNESFGAFVLSMVGGYVDTAGFMAMFGLFTAHVTGDLITAASTIFEGPQMGAYVRLAMIPIFMCSVGAVTIFARAIQCRGAQTLAPLLTLETLLLGLFCAAGMYLHPYMKNPNAIAIVLVGGLGVAAMGVQNSLMKGALKSFSQTTLMTGNLTQFTIDLVEYFFPASCSNSEERTKARREYRKHVRRSGLPLLGFLAGAGIGAWFTKQYGLLSIALPAGVVAILSVVAWVRSRKKKS
jgi:uncharacterized membrane protein YoaK (UPF0700 family)